MQEESFTMDKHENAVNITYSAEDQKEMDAIRAKYLAKGMYIYQ